MFKAQITSKPYFNNTPNEPELSNINTNDFLKTIDKYNYYYC
jgi:hypothetical protein